MTETEVSKFIYETYGQILDAVILVEPTPVTAPIMAGLMHRESAGGLTLHPPGPEGTGDGGHGRGLCQIDDRYYPIFTGNDEWKDPRLNITFAKGILEDNYHYFLRLTQDPPDFSKVMMMALSAYNAGIGGVKRGLKLGRGSDHFTTGGNYGSEVMRLSSMYTAVSILEKAKQDGVPNG